MLFDLNFVSYYVCSYELFNVFVLQELFIKLALKFANSSLKCLWSLMTIRFTPIIFLYFNVNKKLVRNVKDNDLYLEVMFYRINHIWRVEHEYVCFNKFRNVKWTFYEGKLLILRLWIYLYKYIFLIIQDKTLKNSALYWSK